jgi:hypothetical protein
MEGALGFRHALHDAAVLEHDIVRRHLAFERAQTLEGGLAVEHPGVVEEDHVGLAPVAALAAIGRGNDIGDDRGIRLEG